MKNYDPNSGRYLDQRRDQAASHFCKGIANIGIRDTWKICLGVTNLLDHTDDLYGLYKKRRYFTSLEGAI
ncbi:hypothetical protein GF406_09330 [candidate division KSB1 bacterium]|nr:hypothetical protein [candidate division KSB1 bacterium]